MTIFKFQDYRTYLSSWLTDRPKAGRGEVTRMAEALNVHPTLMSQVLTSRRDLNEEQASDLADYLGLNELESEYFVLLVRIERAGTKRYKSKLLKKRQEIQSQSDQVIKRVRHDRTLTADEKSVFYSSYLYSAIRLYCAIEDGQSLESILRKFSIEREKALEILDFLVQAELCKKDGSTYQIGPQITHLESTSPLVVRHHLNWRLQAISRSERLSKEELMFSGPLSISKEDFQFIREQLLILLRDVSLRVKDSKAEEIGCLNIDLFWVK